MNYLCRVFKERVVYFSYWPLAQSVEQDTHNVKVTGS